MNFQSVSNAAYTTLQGLGMAPEGATFNSDRYIWEFEATDAQMGEMMAALRAENARNR